MTFKNTDNIDLKIKLDSKEKARKLIQQFIDEHNQDTSSFDNPIKVLMRSSEFSKQFTGLTQLYQRLIIPQLEKKLNGEAWEETKQKWQRQGKSPFVKKTLFNGKVVNDTLHTFDAEVKKALEQKKKRGIWEKDARANENQ